MTYVRNGRRYFGTEHDEPPAMVPLALGRRCDKCGLVTYTATSRQKVKGRHPLCEPGAYIDVLTPDGERAVLVSLMRTFPGAVLTTPRRPE